MIAGKVSLALTGSLAAGITPSCSRNAELSGTKILSPWRTINAGSCAPFPEPLNKPNPRVKSAASSKSPSPMPPHMKARPRNEGSCSCIGMAYP